MDRWAPAFTDTSLEEFLREHGVTQVFLAGVATSIGVEPTARPDAMTDSDPAAHENGVERIFPRLGETATTSEVIGMLGAS